MVLTEVVEAVLTTIEIEIEMVERVQEVDSAREVVENLVMITEVSRVESHLEDTTAPSISCSQLLSEQSE